MLIHDKCNEWEIKIQQLEKELKEKQKEITRLELILGLTYIAFCIILSIIVAYHTPIGY
jgi:cell division protein FtsL